MALHLTILIKCLSLLINENIITNLIMNAHNNEITDCPIIHVALVSEQKKSL